MIILIILLRDFGGINCRAYDGCFEGDCPVLAPI